jgi:hypothetical protein
VYRAVIPAPFVGSGSVNKFPLLGIRFLIMQLQQCKSCVSTWSLPKGYKRDEVWSVVS